MMGQQAIHFELVGDVTIAALQTSEITPNIDKTLRERLLELGTAGRPARFILDLSKLEFLGSVGLSVLVVFLKRIRGADGQLIISGLTGHCQDVMTVTELDKVFTLCDGVESALDKIRAQA